MNPQLATSNARQIKRKNLKVRRQLVAIAGINLALKHKKYFKPQEIFNKKKNKRELGVQFSLS
jgi:hypothetical protein